LDDPQAIDIIAVAQGSHLVLPEKFLKSKSALMVPKTSDGRVLFAIPWHQRLVVGTTDFGVPKPVEEPRIQPQEVDFILSEAAKYLAEDPTESDVLACYTGLRPLVKHSGSKSTAALSRDHTVLISESGLVTITGGKWTTYRHMGEDCLNHAEKVAGFEHRPSKTTELNLHGCSAASEIFAPPEHLAVYGTDRKNIEEMVKTDAKAGERLHPRLPYLTAEAKWAIDREMARTIEDVLSRRTRALLLDVKAAVEAAPGVARLLAEKLSRDPAWETKQVQEFSALAKHYSLN
jgi:glycerol-3-phosphate dehydrogenase